LKAIGYCGLIVALISRQVDRIDRQMRSLD
jgi:hypothetical protein